MGGEGRGTEKAGVHASGAHDVAEPGPPGPGRRTSEAWVVTLRGVLLTVLAEDDVDVTAGAEPGVVEVSTDDWTLRVEGLIAAAEDASLIPVTAWVAIDDEPEDPARYRTARRAVMPPAIDRALARANEAMDGALRAALVAGGDPFSQDLVAGMSELGGPPPVR